VHWLIDVEVSPTGIKLAQQRLFGILAARDIAPERIGDVEIIVEELLTNIVRAAVAKDVTLDCALTTEDIVVAIRDNGVEFDPLKPESPNLDADIAERGIGGLGIHLVRQLADDCSYARVGIWNVFEVRLARTVH
jgi:sigma-B regulation protein RsbU (phosphoserine phosphatase)